MVREPGWPVTLLGTLPNATVTDRLLSGGEVEVERIRPDRQALRDRHRRHSRERQRLVRRRVDGAVDRVGRAHRHVRRVMVAEAVAELVREANADLAAPRETCTTWRSTLFDSDAGGLFAVSVSCGAPVQVPTPTGRLPPVSSLPVPPEAVSESFNR